MTQSESFELNALRDIIQYAETLQPDAIQIIRKYNFVFKTELSKVHPTYSGDKTAQDLEKLAFTFYSMLASLDSRIRKTREMIELEEY